MVPVDAEQEIRRRIAEQGRITFAEFMELALFWPKGGYYTSPDNIGSEGDFYTAPGAHPALGALLCVQAYQVWQLLGCPKAFWVLEMGAGQGLLCHDIMAYSLHLYRPFRDALRYICLDRVPSRGIEEELPLEARSKVERLVSANIPMKGLTGFLLSNELLDSFPVHRVVPQDGGLKEIYVCLDEDGQLVEVAGFPSTPALEERLKSLDISLPDGFHAEINLDVDPWIREVSSSLEKVVLLTIDYGHSARELYSDQRRRGTLTCFYKHTQTNDPYRHVGKQDITSQVDFTSLMDTGKRIGMDTLGFATQRAFLNNLGLGRFMADLRTSGLKQQEMEANRMGMLDISRPGGMGDFKVLAQGKGVGSPSVWGFQPSPDIEHTLKDLPAPLLTPHHMSLLQGRYPHLDVEWEEMLR